MRFLTLVAGFLVMTFSVHAVEDTTTAPTSAAVEEQPPARHLRGLMVEIANCKTFWGDKCRGPWGEKRVALKSAPFFVLMGKTHCEPVWQDKLGNYFDRNFKCISGPCMGEEPVERRGNIVVYAPHYK